MLAWWWLIVAFIVGAFAGGIGIFVYAISDAIEDGEKRWKNDE